LPSWVTNHQAAKRGPYSRHPWKFTVANKTAGEAGPLRATLTIAGAPSPYTQGSIGCTIGSHPGQPPTLQPAVIGRIDLQFSTHRSGLSTQRFGGCSMDFDHIPEPTGTGPGNHHVHSASEHIHKPSARYNITVGDPACFPLQPHGYRALFLLLRKRTVSFPPPGGPAVQGVSTQAGLRVERDQQLTRVRHTEQRVGKKTTRLRPTFKPCCEPEPKPAFRHATIARKSRFHPFQASQAPAAKRFLPPSWAERPPGREGRRARKNPNRQ